MHILPEKKYTGEAIRALPFLNTVLPDLSVLFQDLRLAVFFHERRDLVHQTVREGIVRHDRRNTDHDDLMGILFARLRGGDMELILNPGENAPDDHSLFFQAVNPGGVQPERHNCDLHRFLFYIKLMAFWADSTSLLSSRFRTDTGRCVRRLQDTEHHPLFTERCPDLFPCIPFSIEFHEPVQRSVRDTEQLDESGAKDIVPLFPVPG